MNPNYTTNDPAELQAKQIRQTLYAFNPDHPQAIPAGGFYTALIHAAGKADKENEAKLAKGYPALIWAIETLQSDLQCYDKIEAKLKELATERN